MGYVKTDLTQYDVKPEALINYLRYNGPHFNKKLLEFAISNMKTKQSVRDLSGIKLIPYSIEHVDKLLQQHQVTLENNQLYDYVYVANMCKADFLNSSILNELQVAKYIKDVIDDIDGYDGMVFNRWYADMCRKGIVINWEKMI